MALAFENDTVTTGTRTGTGRITDAAEMVGVAWQQFQKYEVGDNRITAGKLAVLAKGLGKRLDWFFAGVDLGNPDKGDLAAEMMATADGAALAKAFVALDDTDKQKALLRVAEAMGA